MELAFPGSSSGDERSPAALPRIPFRTGSGGSYRRRTAGGPGVSREAIWDRVRMAWTMLSGRTEHDVQPGRPREAPPPPTGDEPPTEAEGFAEEALPWLDAVYAFAVRLPPELRQRLFARILEEARGNGGGHG